MSQYIPDRGRDKLSFDLALGFANSLKALRYFFMTFQQLAFVDQNP